jgi:predicted Zn-dependent protease
MEALASIEGVLRDEPGHLLTTIWAARTLSALGRFAEALEVLQRIPPQAHTPYLQSCMAYAVAGLGHHDEARSICERLLGSDAERPCSRYFIAATYAKMSDYDTAVDALMESHHMRDGMLVFVLTQTSFEPLRGHPGFERLLADMRFPVPRTVLEPAQPAPTA